MEQVIKTSQNNKILNHLQTKGSITSFEAFSLYRITRLSARIANLRDAGYHITTTMRTEKNAEGTTSNFAVYRLEEVENG